MLKSTSFSCEDWFSDEGALLSLLQQLSNVLVKKVKKRSASYGRSRILTKTSVHVNKTREIQNVDEYQQTYICDVFAIND